MDELNDRLEGLTALVVEEPPPVSELVDRARRRQRRHVGAVGLLCVIVLAAGILVFPRGDEADDVSTADDPVPAVDDDGPWSKVPEPPIGIRSNMTVAWTGTEILIAGGMDIVEGPGADGESGTSTDEAGNVTPIHEERGIAAAAYDPVVGTWRRLADLPFVPNRVEASTWTGSELLMLVHEQVDTEINGPITEARVLRLDPAADEWEVVDAPEGADVHLWQPATAFTGSEWLLWGYPYHQPESMPVALAFDATTDSWREIDPGPLDFRERPGSVWTGDELIVFAGDTDPSYDISDPPEGEGAAYDPETDTWRVLPPSPATNLRGPSVLWTGSEVLVWGGSFGPSNPTQGAVYDPSSDSWRAMARSPLHGRDDAVVVWTGDRMVVADGTATYNSPSIGASVATYDPATDTWTVLPDPPGGPACNSAGVATTEGVFVFGGSVVCASITDPRTSALVLSVEG